MCTHTDTHRQALTHTRNGKKIKMKLMLLQHSLAYKCVHTTRRLSFILTSHDEKPYPSMSLCWENKQTNQQTAKPKKQPSGSLGITADQTTPLSLEVHKDRQFLNICASWQACVQFLQTAGHCSSCLLSSPLLGLTVPHAHSRPGLPSVPHWSHYPLLNGGCCFLP